MRIIDCFIELVAYVLPFQQKAPGGQPEFEQVRGEIRHLLSQSEKLRHEGQLAAEEYDQARFAVFAWIDETLLNSGWKDRHLWQREQLQRLYYNTTEAGVEVFERLNNLGFHDDGVREVYYLCLALGFKGRYIHQGDEFLLEQLRNSNLKILAGTPAGVPALDRMELFNEACPAQAAEAAPLPVPFRFNLVTALALAGPVVLYGLLYLIYRFALSGVAGAMF